MAKKPKREDDFTNKSKKNTEKTFSGAKDPRSKKGSGKYPNTMQLKARDGTVVYQVDYNEGDESVTWQGRGGQAIQFLANGGVQMTSHNGLYNIVFGENRMSITGANDLHVKGDGSLRVYGDYRKTVHGNVEYSATGSMIFSGQNIINNASENHSITSQTITHKASDAVQISSNQSAAFVGKNTVLAGLETASIGGTQTNIEGREKLSMKSSEGEAEFTTKTTMTQVAGGKYFQTVEDETHQEFKKETKIQYAGLHSKNTGDEVKQVDGDRNVEIAGTGTYDATTYYVNSNMGKSPSSPEAAKEVQLAFSFLNTGTGQKTNTTKHA